MSVCVREKERVCVRESVCEREIRESVCKRERECVCERERETKRERKTACDGKENKM